MQKRVFNCLLVGKTEWIDKPCYCKFENPAYFVFRQYFVMNYSSPENVKHALQSNSFKNKTKKIGLQLKPKGDICSFCFKTLREESERFRELKKLRSQNSRLHLRNTNSRKMTTKQLMKANDIKLNCQLAM